MEQRLVTLSEFSEVHGINLHTVRQRFKKLNPRPIPALRMKLNGGGYGVSAFLESDLQSIAQQPKSKKMQVEREFLDVKPLPSAGFYVKKELQKQYRLMAAASRCYG